MPPLVEEPTISQSPTPTPQGLTGQVSKWIVSNLVTSYTLLGLFIYALLRISYSLFYGRFGVSPEEVGLGFAEILSQAAVGILFVFAIQFVVVLPWVFLGRYAHKNIKDWLNEKSQRVKSVREQKGRIWAAVELVSGPIISSLDSCSRCLPRATHCFCDPGRRSDVGLAGASRPCRLADET